MQSAKAKPSANGAKDSTATIGFEAGKESSPELQLACASREGQPPHPAFGTPEKSPIDDPACGSGGGLPAFRLRRVRSAHSGRAIAPRGVQSEKFIQAHGGKPDQVAIYGQESNATTRRLAVMNLAIRGITADFGPEHADTFRRDLHPDLRADYVLANPPFNDSDWKNHFATTAIIQTKSKHLPAIVKTWLKR